MFYRDVGEKQGRAEQRRAMQTLFAVYRDMENSRGSDCVSKCVAPL
jgi:hypothetical protein